MPEQAKSTAAEVGPVHHQAYGIVHGGVYAGMIESVASVGAALWARRYDQTVVGLENQTSFLVATRERGPAVERNRRLTRSHGRLCRLRLRLIDGHKLFRYKSLK